MEIEGSDISGLSLMEEKKMHADDILNVLKAFKWNNLQAMYGNSHSSIIGFISTTWIEQTKDHCILDGAPSPETGQGRKGQTHADILLCKRDKPFIVVEVEANVVSYSKKLATILKYLQNDKDFGGLEFGLMLMLNFCEGKIKYKHNWEGIQEEAKKAHNIALVSIEREQIRERIKASGSILDSLRLRNDYYPWEINNIDYWICATDGMRSGNLWKNQSN